MSAVEHGSRGGWTTGRLTARDAVRFWRLSAVPLNASDDCWVWLGTLDMDGYGRFSVRGRDLRAHRVAYELKVKHPIPDDLVIDHLCRNRQCVNPAHMEPVTIGENTRRAPRFHLPTCKHGHAWTAATTKIRGNGTRNCVPCSRRRSAESYARRSAARRARAIATHGGHA